MRIQAPVAELPALIPEPVSVEYGNGCFRLAAGPDPPGDWVIEPCLDETLPDYDTDPDPIYANE